MCARTFNTYSLLVKSADSAPSITVANQHLKTILRGNLLPKYYIYVRCNNLLEGVEYKKMMTF